jgi:integrase
MANKRTKLLRYAKTSEGWRRGNAIIGKTGKVKPDYMLYKKQDLYCPEGYFIIRTYVGKQPKYKDVGNDALEALAACKREQELIDLQRKLKRQGYDFPEQPEKTKRKALHESKETFLEEKSLEPHRSEDSMSSYRIVVKGFVKSCGKHFADQIEGTDILRYCNSLEESGNSDRTRANRFGTLCTFLRHCKIDPTNLLSKAQIHKLKQYVESEVEIYGPEELAALIAASKSREALLWEFLYNTGLRFLEAAFLEWTDIDFNRKTLSFWELS